MKLEDEKVTGSSAIDRRVKYRRKGEPGRTAVKYLVILYSRRVASPARRCGWYNPDFALLEGAPYSELMRLYTMQPSTVLANLDAGFTHRPRLELCERDGFLGMAEGKAATERAYNWMIAQLTQQEAPQNSDSLPVWAWHTYDPKRPGLDLRVFRPRKPGVLLELEVDPARVLLSDYELWFWVLNGSFLGNQSDCRAIDALCKKRGVEWDKWWTHPDIAEQVCASWKRCLDLKWYVPRWEGKPAEEKSLQGVMWEIRPEDVRRSKVFKGWPRSARGGQVLLWQ